MLEPSLIQHGLVFSEGQLEYVSRTASETTKQRSFQGIENPILKNVRNGRFERRSSNLLAISVTLQSPDASDEQQTFERRIFLRGR
ncbi:MAG: hypothetical protein BWY66_01317 [bacterium ADurb.Bin374]|nr:MAG: hypothetical protein BWY66_01317 [bacterium ADurb.Bin374]